MERDKLFSRNSYFLFFQAILMFFWGAQLLYSSAFYVDYLLILITAFVCFFKSLDEKNICLTENNEAVQKWIVILFASLFTCMVAFANYPIWSYVEEGDGFSRTFRAFYGLIKTIIFFAGGFSSFWYFFNMLTHHIEKIIWKVNKNIISPTVVFCISFLIIFVPRFITLFFCTYPGILTADSINQLQQVFSGVYSNDHPYYQTQAIRLFVLLGTMLFHEINAAVATYSFFQILFTTICFSFCISTMVLVNAPVWMIVLSVSFYAFMPYHILYSVVMWKDVPFGCATAMFILFVFRLLYRIGNNIVNWILFVVSSLAICLFRGNGFFAFVIITVSFALMYRLQEKKILFSLVLVIIISFFMTHTVLNRLNVKHLDTIEGISIPAQQIARVVKEGRELNDWQIEMLERIIDVDRISELYDPDQSNNIKDLIKEKGNWSQVVNNKLDYIKLYFQIGMAHPTVYLRAWIDQTKGYWNAGYEEAYNWRIMVANNNYGIKRTVRNEWMETILERYLWIFLNLQGLRLLLSIGLFVWIDIILLYISLLRRDKTGVFSAVPVLTIVLSLLIATPVNSELRYIYSIFCALPVTAFIVLRPDNCSLVKK